MRMLNFSKKLDVYFCDLIEIFFHFLVSTVKALAKLHKFPSLSKPLLVAHALSTKPNIVGTQKTHLQSILVCTVHVLQYFKKKSHMKAGFFEILIHIMGHEETKPVFAVSDKARLNRSP